MKEGDFIEIDFVGRIKDTGEIFDLTDEELAKKEGMFDKDHKYGPALIVVGAQSILSGLEEKIKEMNVGDEKEFELKSESGFGKRDPKSIQIISISKFYEQKLNPVPGAYVNIDGRNCRIQSVSGGRVRVDFNHPLAGKDLLYKVKILREITDLAEKLRASIKNLGIEAEGSLEGEAAVVKLKKPNKVIEQIVEQKIKKTIKEIKTIRFESPEDKKPEKDAEAKPVST